jgi:hypothetical protein
MVMWTSATAVSRSPGWVQYQASQLRFPLSSWPRHLNSGYTLMLTSVAYPLSSVSSCLRTGGVWSWRASLPALRICRLSVPFAGKLFSGFFDSPSLIRSISQEESGVIGACA